MCEMQKSAKQGATRRRRKTASGRLSRICGRPSKRPKGAISGSRRSENPTSGCSLRKKTSSIGLVEQIAAWTPRLLNSGGTHYAESTWRYISGHLDGGDSQYGFGADRRLGATPAPRRMGPWPPRADGSGGDGRAYGEASEPDVGAAEPGAEHPDQ